MRDVRGADGGRDDLRMKKGKEWFEKRDRGLYGEMNWMERWRTGNETHRG